MGLFFTSTAAAMCGEVRLFEQLYAKYYTWESGTEMSEFFFHLI